MSVPPQATDALRELEEELAAHKLYAGGEDSVRIAERIRQVRPLFSRDNPLWIGPTQAKRLLGVASERTVKAWARSGYLRSRTMANGRLQVLLDDVLEEREAREDLAAFGGGDLSQDEMMHALRPRLYPAPENIQPVHSRAR